MIISQTCTCYLLNLEAFDTTDGNQLFTAIEFYAIPEK
jgi:hypothetical protein